MLTREDHVKLLRTFDVDQLLTLLELEAQRASDGHYTIFRFNAGFKVAFGTPGINPPGCQQHGYVQLLKMTHYPTLKEAIIEAIVAGKTFDNYFEGDPDVWWAQHMMDFLYSYPELAQAFGLPQGQGADDER